MSGPAMVRVLVSPEVVTKLPQVIVLQAAARLDKELRDNPRRAKKKTQEIVKWDGTRIALICEWKEKEDLVLITRARQLKG